MILSQVGIKASSGAVVPLPMGSLTYLEVRKNVANSSSSPNTSFSVPRGQYGDLQVFLMGGYGVTPGLPSGCTNVMLFPTYNSITIRLCYRICAGGAGDETLTWSGSAVGVMYHLRHPNYEDLFNGDNYVKVDSLSSTPTPGTLPSPISGGVALVTAFGLYTSGSGSITPPSGYTQTLEHRPTFSIGFTSCYKSGIGPSDESPSTYSTGVGNTGGSVISLEVRPQ
jgi:hypothetical protein